MKANWAASVVERLAELRAAGHDFDHAWGLAIRQYPLHGDGTGTPRLFEEDGRAAEGLAPFLKRVAENAYNDVRSPRVGLPGANGNGPAIRHFRVEMIREVDDASPARRSTSSHGRYRMAA